MADNVKVIRCDCHSVEHQIVVSVDDEFFYFEPHLCKRNIFQRIKYGLLYILGRQSSTGAFAEVLVRQENIDELVDFLTKNKK